MLTHDNTGSSVWTDTACCPKKNEAWLEKNGHVSDIHHKKPKGWSMSEATACANGRHSKIRAFVEHVFAQQKSRMGPIVHERHRAGPTRIGMANLACNFTRHVTRLASDTSMPPYFLRQV